MDKGRTPAAGGGAARAPRADARRNIAVILRTAETCLAGDPEATMTEIARAAGVGRVTLYGHFPSRADLVDAVFARVVRRADETLEAVDTGGEPGEALRRLAASSWRIVGCHRGVLAAAERELPAGRVRDHHDSLLDRMSLILSRGRETGAFRTDVPASWLATVCMTLMHAAATEVTAGQLTEQEADHAVTETIMGACRPARP